MTVLPPLSCLAMSSCDDPPDTHTDSRVVLSGSHCSIPLLDIHGGGCRAACFVEPPRFLGVVVVLQPPDTALLVVSAVREEFEDCMQVENVDGKFPDLVEGMEMDPSHVPGVVLQQALLAKAMGVRRLCVAVTKMDHETVCWSQDRFLEVRQTVTQWLRALWASGRELQLETLLCVPVSGLQGDNLVQSSQLPAASWWRADVIMESLHGPATLEQALRLCSRTEQERVEECTRRLRNEWPLRLPLQDRYKIGTRKVLVGRVETGVLRSGMQLSFAPCGTTAVVGDIECDGQYVSEAFHGQNCAPFSPFCPVMLPSECFLVADSQFPCPLTPSSSCSFSPV